MTKLTKNFWRAEFACKCGCGFDTVDIELVQALQALRDYGGVPIVITSGCRCEEYNAKVGGGTNSQHLRGRAADIVIEGVDPSEIYHHLNDKYPDRYGLGLYEDFVHVDTRSNGPARWHG